MGTEDAAQALSTDDANTEVFQTSNDHWALCLLCKDDCLQIAIRHRDPVLQKVVSSDSVLTTDTPMIPLRNGMLVVNCTSYPTSICTVTQIANTRGDNPNWSSLKWNTSNQKLKDFVLRIQITLHLISASDGSEQIALGDYNGDDEGKFTSLRAVNENDLQGVRLDIGPGKQLFKCYTTLHKLHDLII